MKRKRRVFKRKLGARRYRKMFIIAVEGIKTEPQYFAVLNEQRSFIRVKCLKSKKDSSPLHVLDRMSNWIKSEGLNHTDEAWLVVDKDQWSDKQLNKLYAWSQQKRNYGFALSNPKFEYWLLLHFEDGAGIGSAQECSRRLKKYLPGYNKGIDARKLSREMIEDAIQRAKDRDVPPCIDWPRRIGKTTVYRLVESILTA